MNLKLEIVTKDGLRGIGAERVVILAEEEKETKGIGDQVFIGLATKELPQREKPAQSACRPRRRPPMR